MRERARIVYLGMTKTVFLQIRMTTEDRARMDQAAAKDHLDTSTWARRILLRELDQEAADKAPAT